MQEAARQTNAKYTPATGTESSLPARRIIEGCFISTIDIRIPRVNVYRYLLTTAPKASEIFFTPAFFWFFSCPNRLGVHESDALDAILFDESRNGFAEHAE